MKECGSTDRHRPKNKLERKELFFSSSFFSRKACFEADVLGLKGVVNCLLPQHALYSVRDAFTCPDPLKTHLNLFFSLLFASGGFCEPNVNDCYRIKINISMK